MNGQFRCFHHLFSKLTDKWTNALNKRINVTTAKDNDNFYYFIQ